MSFLDNLFTLSTQLNGYLAKLAGTVTESNRLQVDLGGTTLSGSFSADVPDTTATGTLASTSDAVTVAMEGRPYAGFSIAAGFTGTITFEASFDGGTTFASVQTYTPGLPPTITGATLSPAGSASSLGIIVPIGATHVRARASTGGGTASATIRATIAGVMSVFPQLASIITLLSGALTVGLPSGASTAANQSTGNTSLASIASALAGTLTVGLPSGASTSANQSTGNTSLASILTALNPGSSVTGQTSSTNSDATFSSQTCALGFWVKNMSTSSQVAYIKPGATATTGNGWQLNVGDAPLWVPCSNMNTVHHISSASGANLCWQSV